jgi:sigma-B regulation protein RsbU (phosphoserine phosphatase)
MCLEASRMSDPVAPRILVCAPEMTALAELRRLLSAGGHDANGHLLGTPDPDVNGYQLVVVDASRGGSDALDLCRRLRSRLEEGVVPILCIFDDHSPAARLASFEAGADTYLLRPFAPGEVLAQVKALLRIKDTHDRLAEKTAEIHRINKRLQAAHQQMDQELELAQRIQSSFLPQTLPEVPHGRFAVHYLQCGRVGGDFYDVFRLDENHVGFYVADAMGHGVPASLLTIFIKKGIKAKEVFGQQYRLVPPGEVLSRLNKELIDQQLSENPFITIVYGLLNFRDGTLQFARAGHPYPLYVPRDGALSYWQMEGLLLGVVDAGYRQQTHPLQRGDKVLFYSDGIDSATFDGHEPGNPSLLACVERHRQLPVREFVAQVTRDLFGAGEHPDDLTLLGLEILD